MKKNFGFTLAEVLITLGIIGVVAALTAPALVKNSGQAKIGPALAKFVNTFETGCEQMMTEENANKLSSIASKDEIWTKLSNYIIMTELGDEIKGNKDVAGKYRLYAPDGTDASEELAIRNSKFWQLKDGSIMFNLSAAPMENAWSANGVYKGPHSFILYDINGLAGNNRAGKEVFLFCVDESGLLIPYQSNTYGGVEGLDYGSPSEECDLSSSSVWNGFPCTGKIADNGWKAEY